MRKGTSRANVSEALRDLPEWRRKKARSFLWYAALLPVLPVLLIGLTWLLRHRIADQSSANPVMAIEVIVGDLFAAAVVTYAVYSLLSIRRRLLEHNDRESRPRQSADAITAERTRPEKEYV